MALNEGVSASPVMATPIRVNDRSMAGLRPRRSPSRPITAAPTGRIRKPAPKVASEARRLEVALADGKKLRPIWAAKKA